MKQKSDLEPSTLSWLAYYSSQSLYRTMALQSTKTPYDFLFAAIRHFDTNPKKEKSTTVANHEKKII